MERRRARCSSRIARSVFEPSQRHQRPRASGRFQPVGRAFLIRLTPSSGPAIPSGCFPVRRMMLTLRPPSTTSARVGRIYHPDGQRRPASRRMDRQFHDRPPRVAREAHRARPMGINDLGQVVGDRLRRRRICRHGVEPRPGYRPRRDRRSLKQRSLRHQRLRASRRMVHSRPRSEFRACSRRRGPRALDVGRC